MRIEMGPASGEVHGEFCQHETFAPECADHHVLLVTRAQYGRMAIGQCVKTDFGFVGCYDDVTDLLDRKCSGRRSCEITIVDPNFENRKPCNEEFKNHLEVWYTCVPVNYPLAGSCDIHLQTPAFATQDPPHPPPLSPRPPPASPGRGTDASTGGAAGFQRLVVTDVEGFLPSSIAEDTGCGTDASPWVISVSKGQRLRISIYDFNIQQPTQPGGPPTNPLPQNSLICYKYGLLLEPFHRKSIDICAGSQRQMLTYDSKGETIHLSISRPGHSYMVKYEAVGCPDVATDKVRFFRRDGSRLAVGCYSTSQEWHLTCRDTQWVGVLGNCTNKKGEVQHSSGGGAGTGADSDFALPPGVMIGVISVVAVCISLAIVIVGLICIKRARHCSRKDLTDDQATMQLNLCGSGGKLGGHHQQMGGGGGGGDYAIKFADDAYAHIFIPNQDCPLHSGTTAGIYGCSHKAAGHYGRALSPGHRAYGVLQPVPAEPPHVGHHHLTTADDIELETVVDNIYQYSKPGQQQQSHTDMLQQQQQTAPAGQGLTQSECSPPAKGQLQQPDLL